MENQEPKQKPGDIAAEEKLRKWLEAIGLGDETEKGDDDQNE